MADFHYILDQEHATTVVRLKGDLINDIKPSFDALESMFSTKALVFDCEGVERINSIGVRHWLMFLDRIAKSHSFSFRNCSESFIDTALMIPGFTRSSAIESFYSCFTCSDCGNEKHFLIKITAGKPVTPKKMTCEKCGHDLKASVDFEEHLLLISAS